MLHLLVLDKKKEDAEFILDGFKKNNYIRRQEPEVYAYLLYVEALIRQQNEFTEKAVAEVKILLDKHPHSAKIFWALMFLDDELQNNPSKKYRMLNEPVCIWLPQSVFISGDIFTVKDRSGTYYEHFSF